MKFQKTLLAASLTLILSACDSDDDNDNIVTPEPELPTLVLVSPEDGAALVEDFPLAIYVTYPDGEQPVDAITSIDVNWPQFDIHQAGKEYGFIDGDSDELFYNSVSHDDTEALSANDLERQENVLWYVASDNMLYKFDTETNEHSQFIINENAQFTELAIDEEGINHIWLYDIANHQIVYFDAELEISSQKQITGDAAVNGLALSEDNLLVLANENNEHIVVHYHVQESQLTHIDSWVLEDFDGANFNDVGLMPDGRIAVSNDDIEENIFLVMDKSELVGNGPLEDDAELELVAEYALDSSIAQPSGIWSMTDGSWMLITDQAEMFALDSNFTITEKVDIEFDSINCNQGCTEAIVGATDRFYALTDKGLVGQFDKQSDTYILTQEFQITATNEDGEAYSYSGLGHDEISGEFYVVPDQSGEEDEDKLIILNSDFTVKAEHTITYAGEAEGSIFEFDAQGVHYNNESIFVLSEKYTKVLQLNMNGEIVAVIDLSDEDVSDPSDIAIRDGMVYITGDHENDEPVPPISVFEIDDEDE